LLTGEFVPLLSKIKEIKWQNLKKKKKATLEDLVLN
jgi:hypothetical protein